MEELKKKVEELEEGAHRKEQELKKPTPEKAPVAKKAKSFMDKIMDQFGIKITHSIIQQKELLQILTTKKS